MPIPAAFRYVFPGKQVRFRRKITRKDAAGGILQHLLLQMKI